MWKGEGCEERKRKRGREERVGSERIGGKKINVVTLQLLFSFTAGVVWGRKLSRDFRLCEIVC